MTLSPSTSGDSLYLQVGSRPPKSSVRLRCQMILPSSGLQTSQGRRPGPGHRADRHRPSACIPALLFPAAFPLGGPAQGGSPKARCHRLRTGTRRLRRRRDCSCRRFAPRRWTARCSHRRVPRSSRQAAVHPSAILAAGPFPWRWRSGRGPATAANQRPDRCADAIITTTNVNVTRAFIICSFRPSSRGIAKRVVR